MYEKIVNEFNAYIKTTILNAVKNFARAEQLKAKNEISIDMIAEKMENKETTLLSVKDDCVVFCFERENCKLEDYFSDEQKYKAVKSLSEEEKEILLLSILGNFTSEEIGKKYNKSANNIRFIIYNAKKKINKKFKEN